MRKASFVGKFWVALAIPLVAGACDDLSGPNLANFDPAQTAASLDSVLVATEDDDEYFSSFDLAESALASQGGSGTASFTLGALNRVAPSIGTMGVIPAEYLGSTYVYDLSANDGIGGYVVDPERTGAPENTVRFIYYAINPATNRPTGALDELGYLDVIDETPEGATDRVILTIRVVDTTGDEPVTLVDYGIDFSGSETITGAELSYDVDGFIADGGDRLNFNLAHSLIFTAGTNTNTMDVAVNHTFVRPTQDVTVIATADGTLQLFSEEPVEGTRTLTVRDGGEEVYVQVTLNADGTLSGTVRYGGIDVVSISGTEEQPVFTREDGTELTESDIEALKKLHNGIEAVTELGDEILNAFNDLGS